MLTKKGEDKKGRKKENDERHGSGERRDNNEDSGGKSQKLGQATTRHHSWYTKRGNKR